MLYLDLFWKNPSGEERQTVKSLLSKFYDFEFLNWLKENFGSKNLQWIFGLMFIEFTEDTCPHITVNPNWDSCAYNLNELVKMAEQVASDETIISSLRKPEYPITTIDVLEHYKKATREYMDYHNRNLEILREVGKLIEMGREHDAFMCAFETFD